MALKSEATVLLSAFFLCFEIRLAGGISLPSIFRFLNCHLGGEADGDTMDWIGDSDKILSQCQPVEAQLFLSTDLRCLN